MTIWTMNMIIATIFASLGVLIIVANVVQSRSNMLYVLLFEPFVFPFNLSVFLNERTQNPDFVILMVFEVEIIFFSQPMRK